MEHNYFPDSGLIGTFTPETLLCGGFPLTPKSVNLKHGIKYMRGSVLQVSATAGIYELVTDDTKAKYILMEDRDLTAATVAQAGNVAATGEFNGRALTLGSGATLAGVTETLEKLNIYVRDTIPVIEAE